MLSRGTTAARILSQLSKRGFAQTTVKLPGYETYLLDAKTLPAQATVTTEDALKYYRQMQTVRRMEVACDGLYKNLEIRGFCHLADGQEGICVGMEGALTFEDCLISAYRVHGQAFMRGDSVFQIIAEMMGKSAGSSKGKGGSMHYYRKKTNWYGGNGIVGAQCSVGTGLGYALKYLNKKNISVVMYGDGAANQGQLFESANMAKLWNLPVVYVCENNRYGMGTATNRSAANTKYYARLDTIPGLHMDAQNVLGVREVMKFAKDWCNAGKGPLCIEMATYRYHGHSMSDPGLSYRTRDEISEMRKTRDPIEILKKIILDGKLASEAELKVIDKETKELVEKAVEDARAAPLPEQKEVYTDIFIHPKDEQFYIRGIEYDQSVFPGGKPF